MLAQLVGERTFMEVTSGHLIIFSTMAAVYAALRVVLQFFNKFSNENSSVV